MDYILQMWNVTTDPLPVLLVVISILTLKDDYFSIGEIPLPNTQDFCQNFRQNFAHHHLLEITNDIKRVIRLFYAYSSKNPCKGKTILLQ